MGPAELQCEKEQAPDQAIYSLKDPRKKNTFPLALIADRRTGKRHNHFSQAPLHILAPAPWFASTARN